MFLEETKWFTEFKGAYLVSERISTYLSAFNSYEHFEKRFADAFPELAYGADSVNMLRAASVMMENSVCP